MGSQGTQLARIQTDALRNFKFQVSFQPVSGFNPNAGSGANGGGNRTLFAQAGFMAVSGLNITTEVIPYREGGMNTTTQKMPGQSDFAPITLSNGLILANNQAADMWDWTTMLFDVEQGYGAFDGNGDFRTDVVVKVLAHPVTKGAAPVKAQFKIYNAWPTSVAFTDLDAGANAIIVQQMTLAHEGFDFKVAKNNNDSSTPPAFVL